MDVIPLVPPQCASRDPAHDPAQIIAKAEKTERRNGLRSFPGFPCPNSKKARQTAGPFVVKRATNQGFSNAFRRSGTGSSRTWSYSSCSRSSPSVSPARKARIRLSTERAAIWDSTGAHLTARYMGNESPDEGALSHLGAGAPDLVTSDVSLMTERIQSVTRVYPI